MNCRQIQELIYYYIYKELNPSIEEYISMHLEECEECNKYYLNILKEIKSNKDTENLSAYIDNELSYKDSIQMKKNIIANPKLRKEYEKLLSLNQLIKNSMSKREFLAKEDFSKAIFKKLNLAEEVYGKSRFSAVTGIILVIFVSVFLTVLALLGI